MGKNLKDIPSQQRWAVESKAKIKIKKIMTRLQEKLFYTTHSKFAANLDNEYLMLFAEQVTFNSKKWMRLKNIHMSSENSPEKTHTSMRLQHALDCSVLAEVTAAELGLNRYLARDIGLAHDIGHYPFAHAGEKILNDYLLKYGMGGTYHPTNARLVLLEERIHENILREIEKNKGRPLTPKEKKKYDRCFMLILDGVAAHNGEGTESFLIANLGKTNEEIDQDFYNAHSDPSTRRSIKSGTVEGTITRFCDPISYVAKDFRDGVFDFREEILNDPEYDEIFRRIGVSEETIRAKHSKKDILVQEVTEIFRRNLVEGSMGRNGAQMSMADLLFEFRNLNYNKSNMRRFRKIVDSLKIAVPELIERYTQYLLNPESRVDAPNQQQVMSFIKTITQKSPETLQREHERIVRVGIEGSLRREIEAVLTNDPNALKTTRRKRIETDLARLRGSKESLNQVAVEIYLKRLLREINMSPEKRDAHFRKYIRAMYPDLSEEEIDQKVVENADLKLDTFTEELARFKTAMYIGNCGDNFLLNMIVNEGLMTQEEVDEQRFTAGGRNDSLEENMRIQAEEIRKREEASRLQAAATGIRTMSKAKLKAGTDGR